MKKSFSYLAAAVALALPMVTLAAEFRVGEQPSVLSTERVTGDVYIAGGAVTAIGAVSGDVAAAGGSVLISGDVGADVLFGGGNVTIISNVGDDIRGGGGAVVIQGRVGGDVLIGGGQVTLGGPGVGGDVVIGGGNVRIDAPVAGSLKAGAGNIYINAPVKGSVTVNANKVTLGPSAVIYGSLSYTSPNELVKENGADVRGEVKYTPGASFKPSHALLAGIISAWMLVKFLMLLVCALVFGLIFRGYSRKVVAMAVERPLAELGRGLLTLIVLPVISVLLVVTLLGIPFGILGLISFIALMLISWIVAPIIMGSYLYRYFFKGEMEVSWKTILVGVLVFQLLSFVPILGWLVQCVTVLITVGVIVAVKWQVVKDWR